jgi:hypothetical protein
MRSNGNRSEPTAAVFAYSALSEILSTSAGLYDQGELGVAEDRRDARRPRLGHSCGRAMSFDPGGGP